MRDTPTFDGHYDGAMRCPRCSGPFLHQGLVEVTQREEDAPKGIHVLVDKQTVRVDTDAVKGNPSARRDGIRIAFWCEDCHNTSLLLIEQHKGNTYMGWEDR